MGVLTCFCRYLILESAVLVRGFLLFHFIVCVYQIPDTLNGRRMIYPNPFRVRTSLLTRAVLSVRNHNPIVSWPPRLSPKCKSTADTSFLPSPKVKKFIVSKSPRVNSSPPCSARSNTLSFPCKVDVGSGSLKSVVDHGPESGRDNAKRRKEKWRNKKKSWRVQHHPCPPSSIPHSIAANYASVKGQRPPRAASALDSWRDGKLLAAGCMQVNVVPLLKHCKSEACPDFSVVVL